MPRLTLPLPPRELKVNRTMGQIWAIAHRIKLDYQLVVAMEAKRQRAAWDGVTVQYPVHIRVTLYLGKGQRCDTFDALSWTKSGFDALVDLGVWPDDSSTWIRPVTVDVQRDPNRPRLELEWG